MKNEDGSKNAHNFLRSKITEQANITMNHIALLNIFVVAFIALAQAEMAHSPFNRQGEENVNEDRAPDYDVQVEKKSNVKMGKKIEWRKLGYNGYRPSYPSYGHSYDSGPSPKSSKSGPSPSKPHYGYPSYPSKPHYGPSRPNKPHYGPSRPNKPHYGPSRPNKPHYGPSRPTKPHYGPSPHRPNYPTTDDYSPPNPPPLPTPPV